MNLFRENCSMMFLIEISKKLPVKGIASFCLSPGKHAKLAAYVPQAKGAPATVLVCAVARFPNHSNGKTTLSTT